MRKYYYVLILIIATTHSFKGQSLVELYDKGYILSNRDTLECFVSIHGSYEDNFFYKLTIDGYKLEANIDTINFIVTEYNSYGRVNYKNRRFLARILCWGRINYYEFVTHTLPMEGPGQGMIYQEDICTYFIEKDSVIIKLPKKKLSDEIVALFKDNEAVFNRVDSKKTKQNQLLELINEYNGAH
jgi:hypothetical protein